MRPLVLAGLVTTALLAGNAIAVPKKPLKKPVEPPTKIIDEETPKTDAPADAEPQPDAAPAPSEVELSVKQHGPSLPWSYEIKNVGERPVRVAADPRLLWFEVQVPGKKKRRTCRLPAELFPKHADKDFSLVLRPGERFGQRFDPRLYCFAAGGQTDLVAGAVVYPRFGWPKQFKTSWKGGKKLQTEQLDAPFAVTPPERPRRGKKKQPRAKADLPKQETHLKLVEGKGLGLRSAYAGWSKDALHEDDKPEQSDWDSPEPMLTMQTGSDAAAERLATVQVKLKNPSKDRKLVVYFRRELLSFEVMGPDGLKSCIPEPRTRFPEAQAFTTLGPGRSISVVSRLVELCPRGTFDRPGLYLIRARFDSKDDGAEFGLQGFTGRIVAEQPATVRIRGGEKPFRLPRR
ncbi:MAG: hypothetical protein H6718_25620 [Polyangiaceae bacterium]|nr:hypothetical protein [Myxococcales bacterium]MCB9588816.1 hypothetical protein [Polyangiaceae bacterium]MCB9605375.1 hypothetical protein [Polyangiaceae bacterium]